MEKDITLLNKFSELKLPWWLLVVPIFNNVTYLIIFKSWFAEFSDRKFIFNYYFWEKIKTFGVLIVSLIVFSILICIFITIDFKFDSYNSDYIYEKFCYVFAGIAVLFNFLYHPINLIFRPRKIVKQYEKYYETQNHKKINFSISSNSFINYKIDDPLFNIKNKLSKLTYYSLFNSDIEFVKKIRNLDINENTFISAFDKERVKNKIVKPSSSGYRYLFSTGFWFLGTLNILFNLFNKKDKFIKKNKYFRFTLYRLLNFC